MMTEKTAAIFAEEINFIRELTAYTPTEEMVPLETLDEAKTQVAGYVADYGDDLPENLRRPETMMMIWNHVVESEHEEKLIREAERQDNEIRHNHPDWLEYSDGYSDPALGSLWIDPEEFRYLMIYCGHYDEQHVTVVLNALRAWADKK